MLPASGDLADLLSIMDDSVLEIMPRTQVPITISSGAAEDVAQLAVRHAACHHARGAVA